MIRELKVNFYHTKESKQKNIRGRVKSYVNTYICHVPYEKGQLLTNEGDFFLKSTSA
jgi:hypothetical protein